MEVIVLERKARLTGEPPRCEVCGAIAEPSICGPVLCGEHTPRQ